MGADANVFIDKIIADAKKKIRADLKDINNQAKKDFVAQANEAVLLYYTNYDPKVYIRTNNLFGNVIDMDISFSVLKGDGFGALIQFNAEHMNDYRDGEKYAVVSYFMYGIHGKPDIKIEKNPALEIMDKFQINYKKKKLDKYFIERGYTVE